MTRVRIITEALGGNGLSRALQAGSAPPEWTPRRPSSVAAWRERVMVRAAARDWKAALAHLAPAFDATGLARTRLEHVQREGGVVVTTGQQPGLFGGPIYTWCKAVGALALADAIERETGIAAAPVFWAATDDADFEEAGFTIVARPGGAEHLEAHSSAPAGTPVSAVALGDITRELTRLRDACGSMADSRAFDYAESAYSEGATHGSAYVSFLREMLAPLGIPVLDASHDAVRSASDHVLRLALRCGADADRSLSTRAAELQDAGHQPQVDPVKGLSLVFAREEGVKRRIPLTEAASFADDKGAVLTPNVLLRPVVEHRILPTVAYVAGPGELAYFAQVGAVADALQLDSPLAVPRWSCTLIEPHIEALLARFDITPDALSRPHVLERVVARRAMSEQTAQTLAALKGTIDALPGALANETHPLGLDAALNGAMQSLLHRVDRLERRIVAGIKRRETDLLRDVATLRGALYPFGKRQERALNIVPILSRHGLGLLGDMRDAASAHADALLHGAPAPGA